MLELADSRNLDAMLTEESTTKTASRVNAMADSADVRCILLLRDMIVFKNREFLSVQEKTATTEQPNPCTLFPNSWITTMHSNK